MKILSSIWDFVTPWPARDKRKEAIAEAEQEKLRSQIARRDAEKLAKQLDKIIRENHFADNLARHLRESGYQRREPGRQL